MVVYNALICPAAMQVVINNSIGVLAGCTKVFYVPTDSAIAYASDVITIICCFLVSGMSWPRKPSHSLGYFL